MRTNDGGIRVIKMVTGARSSEVFIVKPHLNAAEIGIIGIKPPDPYFVCIRDISTDSNTTGRVYGIGTCCANQCQQ